MQLPEPRVLGLKKQAIYETMILQELKVGGILDQLSNEAAKHRLPIRPGFVKEMDVETEIGLECSRKLGTYCTREDSSDPPRICFSYSQIDDRGSY
jgi:hypothetical protein